MTKTIRLSVIIVFAIVFSSCGKRLIYFQEKDNSNSKYSNIELAKHENTVDHVIQAGDILGFKFNSSNTALVNEFSTNTGITINKNGTLFYLILEACLYQEKQLKLLMKSQNLKITFSRTKIVLNN